MIYVLSGGAGLNFKVVGGASQPTNPNENTVWIKTSTPISGYGFRSNQPPEGKEGYVWIITGTTSVGTFNALKKYTLAVYPTGCRQYISGAWEIKPIMIYQSGAWIDYKLWLLNGSNKHTDITGAWQNSTSHFIWAGADTTGQGNATFNSNGIVFASTTSYDIAITKNKVLLTDFKTLKVVVTALNGEIPFCITTATSGSITGTAATRKTITATGTYSIDISKINGSYYIAMGCAYAHTATVSQIWLEG